MLRTEIVRRVKQFAAISVLSLVGAVGVQANPLENGWVLQADASSLNFQSIKNLTKVESSQFANIGGAILPDGRAEIQVDLDSVDTKVDLRNVRMRFFLFETFIYPTANITAQINLDDLADLEEVRRKKITLPVRMSLHGVEKDIAAEVAVTLMSDDLVSVASTTPISIATALFGLTDGVARLEEAAEVSIIPSATISFDFVFKRHDGEALTDFPAFEPGAQVAAAAPAPESAAGSTEQAQTAVAAAEEFLTPAECNIQFSVLKHLGRLELTGNSAELGRSTLHLIDGAADTIRYCPGDAIEIGVHTTTGADEDENLALSNSVAVVIRDRLIALGANADRLLPVGYGDSAPRVPGRTASANRFNQRVEFAPITQ